MQAPFDDGRVGELNDDAVGDPAGRAQRLRSVTSDPDGQFVLGPFQPDLDPVIADLSPGCQVADQPAVGLHLLDDVVDLGELLEAVLHVGLGQRRRLPGPLGKDDSQESAEDQEENDKEERPA